MRDEQTAALLFAQSELKKRGYNTKFVEKKECLSISKKNTCRIEIYPPYYNISYRIKAFLKNEFGGYESAECRYVEDVENMVVTIQHFFSKPEVKKKRNKPADDRNMIFQNALGREIQEKAKSAGVWTKMNLLAKSDKHSCHMSLRYMNVGIYQKEICISWETLAGQYMKRICIEPSSPNFDPDKLIDCVLEISKNLSSIQCELKRMRDIAEDIGKATGIADGLDKTSTDC